MAAAAALPWRARQGLFLALFLYPLQEQFSKLTDPGTLRAFPFQVDPPSVHVAAFPVTAILADREAELLMSFIHTVIDEARSLRTDLPSNETAEVCASTPGKMLLFYSNVTAFILVCCPHSPIHACQLHLKAATDDTFYTLEAWAEQVSSSWTPFYGLWTVSI